MVNRMAGNASTSGTREDVAAMGEAFETLLAASRGSQLARREVRQSAVSLKRDMQRLEQDLHFRNAPERSVLMVSRFPSACLRWLAYLRPYVHAMRCVRVFASANTDCELAFMAARLSAGRWSVVIRRAQLMFAMLACAAASPSRCR